MVTEVDTSIDFPNRPNNCVAGGKKDKKLSKMSDQNIVPTFGARSVRIVTKFSEIRTGDHIAFIKELGYSHHVIVDSIKPDLNLMGIIEFGGNEGFTSFYTDAKIRKSTVHDPFKFYVEKYEYDKSFSSSETIQRAYSRMGEKGYNIFTNNCEHFASWCRTGLYTSRQVRLDSNRILRTAFHLTNVTNILVLLKVAASEPHVSNHYLRVLNIMCLTVGIELIIAKINLDELERETKTDSMEIGLYNHKKTELNVESIGATIGSILVGCITTGVPMVKLFATVLGNLAGRALGRILFRCYKNKMSSRPRIGPKRFVPAILSFANYSVKIRFCM